MENIPDNIPPADQPCMNGLYNWEWFRFHHLKTLEEHYNFIDKQYNERPLGNPYSQDEIDAMLFHLDKLIKLYDWLPNSRGGQGTMEEVKKSRDKFEADYSGKDLNKMSFYDAQEIIFKVFTIYNYMNVKLED